MELIGFNTDFEDLTTIDNIATGTSTPQLKDNFTLLGDPINHAFTLKSAIEVPDSSIVIDEATATLISDKMDLQEMGEISVEGEKTVLYSL